MLGSDAVAAYPEMMLILVFLNGDDHGPSFAKPDAGCVAEPTACSQCHNMLMLLAVSKDMTDKERDIVIPLMIAMPALVCPATSCPGVPGHRPRSCNSALYENTWPCDTCNPCTQVVNPWVTIGGVASSVCGRSDQTHNSLWLKTSSSLKNPQSHFLFNNKLGQLET